MGFWAAAIPIATTLASGLLSKKDKQKTERVPATLGSGDLRGTGLAYRDLVKGYLGDEPGLSGEESRVMLERGNRAIDASRRGADLRSRSYMAQQGIRGPRAANVLQQNEQAALEAKRSMYLEQFLAEHSIRESDIVRRAAVASQFLWPAESARGAGQINQISSNNPSQWLDAIGAGTRAFGALADAGFYNKGEAPTV